MEGLPHILSPVFASQGESGAGYKHELMATENGKIAPYKVLWPAYWGILEQFFFGDVTIDSPVIAEQDSFERMIEFQDIGPFYAWAFAASFVFRPWLKIIALGSCVVLAGVLLLYALRALACIVKVLAGENQ